MPTVKKPGHIELQVLQKSLAEQNIILRFSTDLTTKTLVVEMIDNQPASQYCSFLLKPRSNPRLSLSVNKIY